MMLGEDAAVYGASGQTASINNMKKIEEMLLLDVSPFYLGIETAGGVMTILIERYMPIPTKKTDVFSTVSDNQTSLLIQVHEGERVKTKDNKLLASFDLTGILPARGRVPEIEVTFVINENGILTLHAIEKGTGNSNKIIVRREEGCFSKEEIGDRVNDARCYKHKNRKRDVEGLSTFRGDKAKDSRQQEMDGAS